MRIAVSDPNKQFNATLSLELKKRLEELADLYGRELGLDKGTKVGAKIIETYIEHWADTQERIRKEKKRVEDEIMGELRRPPLLKGATEQRKNPATGRKRKP